MFWTRAVDVQLFLTESCVESTASVYNLQEKCVRGAGAGMHIVYAASECVPFAKTGGLADVVGALPREMAGQGIR